MSERVVTTEEAREQDARELLRKFGLMMRIRLSPQQKPPPWTQQVDTHLGQIRMPQHFRVTVLASDQRKPKIIQFDYWGSVNDAESNRLPSEYDVLCCIGSDKAEAEYSVEELMSELEIDHTQATRIGQLAKKLTTFFTSTEIEAIRNLDQCERSNPEPS